MNENEMPMNKLWNDPLLSRGSGFYTPI
jgi:hypothetical protein